MDIDAGLAFIHRYHPRMPFSGSQDLKNLLIKAAALAATTLLVKCVKGPIREKEAACTYLKLLKDWLTFHKSEPNFNELVHNILGIAISSQHLYFCSRIIEKGVRRAY